MFGQVGNVCANVYCSSVCGVGGWVPMANSILDPVGKGTPDLLISIDFWLMYNTE